MESSEFLDLFRNYSDDELWKITKAQIQEIKNRLKSKYEASRFEAMYKELIHFSDLFVYTSKYSKSQKEAILISLTNYFLLQENYRNCAKIQKILNLIKLTNEN